MSSSCTLSQYPISTMKTDCNFGSIPPSPQYFATNGSEMSPTNVTELNSDEAMSTSEDIEAQQNTTQSYPFRNIYLSQDFYRFFNQTEINTFKETRSFFRQPDSPAFHNETSGQIGVENSTSLVWSNLCVKSKKIFKIIKETKADAISKELTSKSDEKKLANKKPSSQSKMKNTPGHVSQAVKARILKCIKQIGEGYYNEADDDYIYRILVRNGLSRYYGGLEDFLIRLEPRFKTWAAIRRYVCSDENIGFAIAYLECALDFLASEGKEDLEGWLNNSDMKEETRGRIEGDISYYVTSFREMFDGPFN